MFMEMFLYLRFYKRFYKHLRINSFPPAPLCSRSEMNLSPAKVEKAKELHTFRR